MIRLRKYRIFLLVTLCCLLAVYFLSRGSPQYSPDTFTGFGRKPADSDNGLPPPLKDSLAPATANPDGGRESVPTVPDTPKSAPLPPIHEEIKVDADHPTEVEDPPTKVPQAPEKDEGDHDDITTTGTTATSTKLSTSAAAVHWTRKPDSFPVPSESVIALPTVAPKPIPKIQHVFSAETAEQQADTQKKLNAIREAAKRTWEGYRNHAWMKDELKPQSGGSRDKLGGWAATLVDSLDTLWLMDMKEEFEEAVKAAATIDFTISSRDDIPIFETTIRYLGGFLGAYDVSGGTYKVLLDKALELGEVLIGAFDTPNRMPILYYEWAGPRSNNPVRATSSSVLAELGSLSLEFTRLAQLTKDSKYYDAIARVTNELEKFQDKTALPGLWPLHLDASGCGTPADEDKTPSRGKKPDQRKDTSTFGVDRTATAKRPHLITEQEKHQKDTSSFGDGNPDGDKRSSITKRDTNNDDDDEEEEAEEEEEDDFGSHDRCQPVGLRGGWSTFSIGGEADSTYEYLPKEHLLLGGLNDQYRSMYIKAADVIKEHLMYRPMIDDEKRQLLFTGKFDPKPSRKEKTTTSNTIQGTLNPSVGHLTCFQGGMFALGAKIFDRPAELDMAWKLTDACVWGYESSASGIMPEDFTPIMCPKIDDCPWNQTAWWLSIDPDMVTRTTSRGVVARNLGTIADRAENFTAGWDEVDSRNLDEPQSETTTEITPSEQTQAPSPKRQTGPTTESYDATVKQRIENDGLWPGMNYIGDNRYLLRPEAIESVWYMYRISGDEYWRQKGWKMFEAINNATMTTHGYSAIRNVSYKDVDILDEAESFWTAETLKYFFLLFSDPSLISLDEYVLNTEAHPFLRPDVKSH